MATHQTKTTYDGHMTNNIFHSILFTRGRQFFSKSLYNDFIHESPYGKQKATQS